MNARALKPPLIPLDETLADVGEHITPAIPLDAIPSVPDDNRILECAVADESMEMLGGAAGKATNLVGCKSPRRQLPDSDG